MQQSRFTKGLRCEPVAVDRYIPRGSTAGEAEQVLCALSCSAAPRGPTEHCSHACMHCQAGRPAPPKNSRQRMPTFADGVANSTLLQPLSTSLPSAPQMPATSCTGQAPHTRLLAAECTVRARWQSAHRHQWIVQNNMFGPASAEYNFPPSAGNSSYKL